MYMFGKKRDDRRLRHQREAFRSDGTQQRRFVAKSEKYSLTRTRSLEQRADHGPGTLREVVLRRHLGAEIRQRLHGTQEAS